MRPDVLWRPRMVCTIAGCTLEHLRRHAEWTWTDPEESTQERRSDTSERHPESATRDATFLNAALPFALAQAKRHREPVSLLCLGLTGFE